MLKTTIKQSEIVWADTYCSGDHVFGTVVCYLSGFVVITLNQRATCIFFHQILILGTFFMDRTTLNICES